jgi:hypothetical protein
MAQLPAQQRDQLAGNPQPRELILAERRAQRFDSTALSLAIVRFEYDWLQFRLARSR